MFAFFRRLDGRGGEGGFQPVLKAAEVLAERGPQLGHAQPAGEDAADGEYGERAGHGDRRFMNVGGDCGSDARFAVERQVHHAPHVEGRHGGGGETHRPENGGAFMRTVRLPENLVLGEEAREAGNARDGHAADPHGAEGDRDLVLEPAHAPHVLLAAHGVDYGTGTEEEERLEEGVGHEVEDRDPVGADAESQEHVAELADGGVGEDALDIGLHQRDAGGQDRGEGSDGSDDGGGDRGQLEKRRRAGDHVDTGGHHGRRVDQCGDGRGAFHRVGQPDVERELRRLSGGAEEHAEGDDGERADTRDFRREGAGAQYGVDVGELQRADRAQAAAASR